ncbi:hypothetical protein GCM10011344_31060 [Dokdonia pacifica]|uniref:Uncharacterized protein n=1 Tax=Dokdonia pacifica TaxID=1627892 RepID=A0A239BQ30_9FLAO|nr:hypothetical protein [Dokdonia pacifica]GGG28041.1 hypothetical protein GCM10011344_31060 [Dokdonia pacifica]SNS10187.1 hypothetical protein SAMN06265376_106365 [Dokdonia pacifica]
MRRLLKHIGLYILLFLSFATIGDLLVSYRLKSRIHMSRGELHTWRDIYKGTIDAEMAIYGSSRAWVQVDPAILKEGVGKETYNFGVNGFPFPMQLYRHQEYFKHNKHPKQIVLCIDWFSLTRRSDLYNETQFLPYMLFNFEFYNKFKTYEGVNLAKTTIPFYRYLGDVDLYKKLFNESHVYRVKGYRAFDKEFENGKNTSIEIKVYAEVVASFKKFIEELKEEDIGLTLVIAPFYIEGQDRVTNRREHLEVISSISKEYGIPLLDYTQDSLSFDKNLFYNNMHLNKTGAELFSTRLALDLKSIIEDDIK